MTNDSTPTPPPVPGPTAPQCPAPAPQPTRRSRAPWIVGGAVAGVLLLGGAVGTGILIGRSDDGVTVQRITTVDGTDDGRDDTARGDGGTATGSATTPPTNPAQDPVSSVAIANNDDIELTGDTLTRAATAALQAAGGDGVVTAAEYSDDPTHRYEVEVTRADGWEMDVFLDEDFQVVATQPWHS